MVAAGRVVAAGDWQQTPSLSRSYFVIMAVALCAVTATSSTISAAAARGDRSRYRNTSAAAISARNGNVWRMYDALIVSPFRSV